MFARKPKLAADFIEQTDDRITFRCDHDPGSGDIWVNLRMVRGRRREIPVRVKLSHVRRTQRGCFVASGVLADKQAPLPASGEDMITAAAVPYRRKRPRCACRLRLLSPSLPSYRALSLDFSASGVQIEADGELKVDSVISCSLDLPHHESLHCTARVAWCRPEGRSFRAGLEFLKIESDSFRVLEAFEQWLISPQGFHTPFRAPRQTSVNPVQSQPEPEPKPPAGCLVDIDYNPSRAKVTIHQEQGARFCLRFQEPLVFCDLRGLHGSEYDDAVELEESEKLTSVRSRLAVPLGPRRPLFHFEFTNRRDQVVLEVISASHPTVEVL